MKDQHMKELAVPRYFFRIQEGDSSDDVQMDYSSAEHMRTEALRLAGESIQDMRFDAMKDRGWSLSVTDESEQVVFSLTVALTEGTS
jgi:hypothetical protein